MKFNILPLDAKIPDTKARIKFGIDPTSDKLHLGHLIPLKIVKDLKEKGHIIDIVLGTFTAQMGDPSGKDTMRPIITEDETKANALSIIKQITRILGDDINIHFNHTWFNKMSLPQMMNILSKFTTGFLLNRDSFQKRIANEDPIGMHELIVPILQGLDSAELKSDIEIGGTDQLFNFLISRQIQEKLGHKPEICIMAPIINGTDGRKMSKSFGNCIFVNDSPEDVFGKVMSISDATMMEWVSIFFEEFEVRHPMQQKKLLALQITKDIWGEELASRAINHFENTIQNKELPENMTELPVGNIVDIVKTIINGSKTEARRLLTSNAVKINGDKVNDTHLVKSGDVIKVGKRNFAKII